MNEIQNTPGSVMHAAIAWVRSQGREVTTAEIAAVVNRSGRRLTQHLHPAVRAGLLERRLDDGFAFWSIGKGVALEPRVSKEEGDAGDAQRVLRVSAAAVPSVFAYAEQRGAAPFACSVYTDGRMAIERNGRLLLELTNAERLQLLHHAALGHNVVA